MRQSFNNLKTNLTEEDIAQILSLVGNRCRLKTKMRLRSILTYSARSLPFFGIYERLAREEYADSSGNSVYAWSYTAGQSYTDEIRTLRECILGKIY